MKHKCKEMEWAKKFQGIEYLAMIDIMRASPVDWYGPSISSIEYVAKGGFWMAHCDEYATIINFCPFCGEKLNA